MSNSRHGQSVHEYHLSSLAPPILKVVYAPAVAAFLWLHFYVRSYVLEN